MYKHARLIFVAVTLIVAATTHAVQLPPTESCSGFFDFLSDGRMITRQTTPTKQKETLCEISQFSHC